MGRKRKRRTVVKPVVDILFNGKNSNFNNWFSKNRVIRVVRGPNVKRNTKYNYWSLTGSGWRHFFVNLQYGGCGKDKGLLVVTDRRDGCWKTWMGGKGWQGGKGGYPRFLYASKANGCKWADTKCAKEADILTISVL